MRIMLDTNILISVAIFNSERLKQMLMYICDKHTLVLSSYVIEELENVIARKFPNKFNDITKFLYKIPYELNYSPKEIIQDSSISIRDSKDLPILNSAIISDVDIFITGDKDFDDVNIEKPEIMTPSEFFERYY